MLLHARVALMDTEQERVYWINMPPEKTRMNENQSAVVLPLHVVWELTDPERYYAGPTAGRTGPLPPPLPLPPP